jgi:hypothetical protein
VQVLGRTVLSSEEAAQKKKQVAEMKREEERTKTRMGNRAFSKYVHEAHS